MLTAMMPGTSASSWQLRHALNGKILKGDLAPMFKLKLGNKEMRLILAMATALGTLIDMGKSIGA